MRDSRSSMSAHGPGAGAATPHELSTNAALDIMRAGGNAVDAAVAANAVQGVVAPETCGVGGDLFALVHTPGQPTPTCLNASGRAGSGANAALLREEGFTEMPQFGPHSVTVPGCVDGWYSLLESHGSLELSEILEPAIRLAREGFLASTELSRAWSTRMDELVDQPSAASLYPNGAAPERGDRLVRPALASTLETVIEGRDSFYLDRVGPDIVEATSGWITLEDLAQSQSEWVEPVGLELFGRTCWTVPPNSQGYVTLATLAVFEMLDAPRDPADPRFAHLLIEAFRSVAGERDEHLADPATSALPVSALLDRDRLRARAGDIDPAAAGVWPASRHVPGGTAYLCTIDAGGMAVSFIQSNFRGIGSGLSAGASGVWLHDRGGGFDLRPGHPNELGPGKRPLHTLSPTLWTRDSRLELLLGTRGGHYQPQILAQVAAAMFHGAADLESAISRPRWIVGEGAATDSMLSMEPQTAESVVEDLRSRGHTVEVEQESMSGWGPVSAIQVDDAGVRQATADARVDTSLALMA